MAGFLYFFCHSRSINKSSWLTSCIHPLTEGNSYELSAKNLVRICFWRNVNRYTVTGIITELCSSYSADLDTASCAGGTP